MPFLVTGQLRHKPYRATRNQRSGAITLAMKLTPMGYAAVAITDDSGLTLNIEAFRLKHYPPLHALDWWRVLLR